MKTKVKPEIEEYFIQEIGREGPFISKTIVPPLMGPLQKQMQSVQGMGGGIVRVRMSFS